MADSSQRYLRIQDFLVVFPADEFHMVFNVFFIPELQTVCSLFRFFFFLFVIRTNWWTCVRKCSCRHWGLRGLSSRHWEPKSRSFRWSTPTQAHHTLMMISASKCYGACLASALCWHWLDPFSDVTFWPRFGLVYDDKNFYKLLSVSTDQSIYWFFLKKNLLLV